MYQEVIHLIVQKKFTRSSIGIILNRNQPLHHLVPAYRNAITIRWYCSSFFVDDDVMRTNSTRVRKANIDRKQTMVRYPILSMIKTATTRAVATVSILSHHHSTLTTSLTYPHVTAPWLLRTEPTYRRSIFPFREIVPGSSGNTPIMAFPRRYVSSTKASYLPPDYTIDDNDDTNVNEIKSVSNVDANSNDNDDDILPTTRRRPRIIRAKTSSSRKLNPTVNSDVNYESDDDDDFDDDDDSSNKTKNQMAKSTAAALPKKAVSSSRKDKVKSSGSRTSSTGASWMDRNTQFMNTIGKQASAVVVTDNQKPSSSTSAVTSSTRRASVRGSSDTTTTMTSTNTATESRLRTGNNNNSIRNNDNRQNDSSSNDEVVRTFREDFRGTRVFVQGLPESCKWQDLKDHFRIAGKVVFASVSAGMDPNTNRLKGHGIVQFETTAEARTAIRIMRDHPFNGSTLYVREDIQDENSNKQLRTGSSNNHSDNDGNDDDDNDESDSSGQRKGPTPPSKWKCADPEMAAQHLDPETVQTVFQILKARNQARRRRNYEACDAMREELKNQYNVHIDDRLTMWWIGAAPPKVVDQVQGVGRWKEDNDNNQPPPTEWRQIMTTKENDACIDPDLIMGLLKQRDIARREKDFSTADALLEQARTAPSERQLTLRIHDESKTWRIWSDEAPIYPSTTDNNNNTKPRQLRDPHSVFAKESPPAEQCIALCLEHAPDKVEEVRQLLLKFPGREYNILKKLRQRYLNQ